MSIYREKLDFSSLPTVIQGMTEDDSTSAAIIDELIQAKGENISVAVLIILDDMNVRGRQITSLYKMSENNIENFYNKVISITKKDIEKLNENTFTTCRYKAIYDGSSKDREINPDKYVLTEEERKQMINKKNKNHVYDMFDNISKKDLYPEITSDEALKIIAKNGFNCGYKKIYENENGQNIIYRVFYNDMGDIMYTHSLEDPDIFLWGQSKLNVVRIDSHNEDIINCNTYRNVKGIVGYNIELREKPFETYRQILKRNEKVVDHIKYNYYDSNLFPIIESVQGINYKISNSDYENIVISGIYDLLTFPETYYDIDDQLKRIYKILLPYAEDKAYDELIYQLNTDAGVDIAIKLQKALGIKLDKEKLFEAKERFCKNNHNHFPTPKSKFLSQFVVEDPLDRELNKRILKILSLKKTLANN